jgi:hypothetical protein
MSAWIEYFFKIIVGGNSSEIEVNSSLVHTFMNSLSSVKAKNPEMSTGKQLFLAGSDLYDEYRRLNKDSPRAKAIKELLKRLFGCEA